MSDAINHHCGLALVRLRQPLSYFLRRYDDAAWGLRRLYLLMEKQHNRGQDGAGVAVVKFDMPRGPNTSGASAPTNTTRSSASSTS